jgi:hypothetical protein
MNIPDLVIDDLRGGMNDQDPKHILPLDQVVLAQNVEFFESTLGERRRGMTSADIADSGLDDEAAIVHLGTYVPELGSPADTILWAVGGTEATSTTFANREVGVWTEVTPVDAPTETSPEIYQMRSQGIHNKWFVAYKSNVDRTHVWDGTVLRRVGLAAPALAPTANNTGAVGTFTGVRYYRVRTAQLDGSTRILMSEPSPEVTFTPSGTNTGAVITRPTLPSEVETHWIIEASDGDGLWYQLSTILIATTTYTDTIQPAEDYADNGELSPDVGDYDVVPSVRIIKADQDRLIYIGSWEDPEKASRVWWTPVYAAPGVGNDERLPADIDSFTDLDWQDGGGITDASDPVNGSFYAFKWGRIYKGQRTGNQANAYSFYLLDPAHGALPGSVVSGVDEYGSGCVYFIDPSIGPMRVSSSGVQQLQNLGATWRRVNTGAEKIICHGIYYPDKKQLHWWVSVDGDDLPGLKIILQTNEVRSDNNGGTTRGWTTATGDIAEAYCSTVVPENVTREDGSVQLSFRPYMGFADPSFLQIGDTGSADNGTRYRFRLITRPYIQAGLLNRWGAMTAALLAAPLDDDTYTLDVKFIRDFGLETNEVNTDFVPTGDETEVIKTFDNFVMSDSRAIQIEFVEPE